MVPTQRLISYYCHRVNGGRLPSTRIELGDAINYAVEHMNGKLNMPSLGAIYMQDKENHLLYFYEDDPSQKNRGTFSKQSLQNNEHYNLRGIPALQKLVAGTNDPSTVERRVWTDEAVSDARRTEIEDEICSLLEKEYLGRAGELLLRS